MMPGTEHALRMTVAHATPGRTRLRIEGAKLTAEEATRLADAIAAIPGLGRVEVDVRTGSVLCAHGPAVLPEGVQEAGRVALDGIRPRIDPAAPGGPVPITRLARELARLFRDANRDLLSATEGRLDIGTAATLTFLGAGALQVLARQEIHAPPWFNLAWWGFRTFMTLESAAIQDDGRTKGGER